MDPTETKSYRPISNLSVLSKLLERVVCKQLMSYLQDNRLLPDVQSAFRAHHSTETAVLKVLSDILLALDWQSGTSHAARSLCCIRQR